MTQCPASLPSTGEQATPGCRVGLRPTRASPSTGLCSFFGLCLPLLLLPAPRSFGQGEGTWEAER